MARQAHYKRNAKTITARNVECRRRKVAREKAEQLASGVPKPRKSKIQLTEFGEPAQYDPRLDDAALRWVERQDQIREQFYQVRWPTASIKLGSVSGQSNIITCSALPVLGDSDQA